MLEVEAVRAKAVSRQLLGAYAQAGIFGTRGSPGRYEIFWGGSWFRSAPAVHHPRAGDRFHAAVLISPGTLPVPRMLIQPPLLSSPPMQLLERDRSRSSRICSGSRLSRKHLRDALIWQGICLTLVLNFGGQVGTLLDRAHRDALQAPGAYSQPRVPERVPQSEGEKIGPLWIRMLHDNCQIEFEHLGEIPLPVDIHTAQATLQTGCVRSGQRAGSMGELRKAVQQVWKEALGSAADGTYPLRLDEPLWLLSRQGCRKTMTWPCAYRDRCPVVAYCQPGQLKLNIAGEVNVDQSEWHVEREPPRSAEG